MPQRNNSNKSKHNQQEQYDNWKQKHLLQQIRKKTMKKKTIAYIIIITIAIAFATLFFIALGIGFLKNNYKISIGIFIFITIIDTVCIIITKRNIKKYEWKPQKEPKYITVKDYTEITEKEMESEKAIKEIVKNWKKEENQ